MIIPRATYRLQFRNGMTFDRAAGLVPHLKRLGISHLYASPIFTATAGSTHGYDVTDQNEIDPSLGGREGFDRLCATLGKAGLGLILDIVPNHMAASLENAWWRSVIEWGEQSPYAEHFDIDWREPLTLPILGRSFEEAAAAGELAVQVDAGEGGLVLAYFDNRFPLHPASYGLVLGGLDETAAQDAARAAAGARPDAADDFRQRLRELLSRGDAASRVGSRLAELSRDPAFLQRVHEAQPWRLTFWKEARRHLSYRRFFEVTGLVGVRVEEGRVFDDVHRLALELVHSGQVQGLRIDHVDGLADPTSYLKRLRREIGPDTYLVVEKILGPGERLPPEWPIAGTTGYEFIADLAGVLTDGGKAEALDRVYAEAIGSMPDYEAEKRAAKLAMVTENFETELSGLTRMAEQLADGAFPSDLLRRAIAEVVVAFPVYRTYGNAEGLLEQDAALLQKVEEEAHAAGGEELRDAIEAVLRLLRGEAPASCAAAAAGFRTRFQQLTGPVMAKSVEDTLFYRFNRLIALNEVGGEPAEPPGSVHGFHSSMRERVQTQPHGLLATATHDTKRGEDARARLYTISEAPELWAGAVARWRDMHRSLVRDMPGGAAPDPDTEWLLYQALAGVWPVELTAGDAEGISKLRERFLPFVEKALREAKRRTSWTETDAGYEGAVRSYAERLLAPGPFLEDFCGTLRPFVRAGALNSLTQTLLKLTAPGIPDIYQGTEGWDFSLVDPDNRRDVDHSALSGDLDAPAEAAFSEQGILRGAAKRRLLTAGLRLREARPELFAQGEYLPLEAEGPQADRVIAFARRLGSDLTVVAAPRFLLDLCRDGFSWGDAAHWEGTSIRLPAGLPAGTIDVLTGAPVESAERLQFAQLLRRAPVALLGLPEAR